MARWEDLKINVCRITSLYLGSGLGTLVTAAAATINKAISHTTTAGIKIVQGQLNLAASDFSITTGLTTITSVKYSIKSTAAPSNVVLVSWNAVGGTLHLYGWKFTSLASPVYVAASSTASIFWEATGT